MLERITLTNFQCHDRLSLDLNHPIVILSGRSDAGKSSILRAIRWVAANRPEGTGFVGRFGKANFARVVLTLDEGTTIGRRRGRDNLYRLHGQVYSAFGTGVPPTVAELLNVGEENFQGQFSPPFWFTLPPPEVARQLNGIINLGLIDQALTNAARMVRRTSTEVQVCEDRLKEATEQKDKYAWAVEFEAAVTEAEAIQVRLEKTRRDAALLRHAATECLARVQAAEKCRKRSGTILDALKAGRAWSARKTRADELRALGGKVRKLTDLVNKPAPDLPELGRAKDAYENARRRQRELNSLALGAAQLAHEIDYATVQMTGLQKEMAKLTKGRCPTCGRSFTNNWPPLAESLKPRE